MHNSRLTLGWPPALWLALLFLTGPGIFAQDLSKPPADDDSRAEQVQALYAEAARNLRAAGHEVTLEVHHLTTIPREQFTQYKTYEIFSMGEGVCLYVEPHTHGTNVQMSDGSQREIERFITFHLEWKPDSWLLNADSEQAELFHSFRTRSFADYMKEAARDDGSLEDVEAVTSFEVHLRYDGRDRVYRAMSLWFPQGSTEMSFVLIDRVALQLEKALEPGLPVRSEEALKAPVEIPKELQAEIAEMEG